MKYPTVEKILAAEKFDKMKWVDFARQTLTQDAEGGEKLNVQEFGDLMQKVFEHSGEIESVLWSGANPNGTEDRTWVRTWAGLKGIAAYQDMQKGLDGAHAQRILKQFKAVGFP